MASLPYSKTIDDIASLTIDESFNATMELDELQPVCVTLANEAEANKLIAEFEDSDGELCWHDDSIMGKYPAFHPFRP